MDERRTQPRPSSLVRVARCSFWAAPGRGGVPRRKVSVVAMSKKPLLDGRHLPPPYLSAGHANGRAEQRVFRRGKTHLVPTAFANQNRHPGL